MDAIIERQEKDGSRQEKDVEKFEEIKRFLNSLDYNTFITFILLGQIRGAHLIALCNSSRKLTEYCNRSLVVTNFNQRENNEENNINCETQYLFRLLLNRINFRIPSWKTPRQTYIERAIGGEVLALGSNNHGQLSLGSMKKTANNPTLIYNLKNIIQISAGSDFTLFLDNKGIVWATGSNQYGQLGLGNTDRYWYRERNFSLQNIVQISSGKNSSLCLDRKGNVWGFGSNGTGELGLGDIVGTRHPILIESLENIVQVCCGNNYSICLDNKGQVWGLGVFFEKQALKDISHRLPVLIPHINNIIQVSIGESHSLYLDDRGYVWGLGNNYHGQLGLGVFFDGEGKFNLIHQLVDIVQVCCGVCHSICLDRHGKVWVFGLNTNGELGLGDIRNRYFPVKIEHLTGIVQISCTDKHALCLNNQGRVWVFGNNKFYQLGLGTAIDRLEPILNAKLKDVISVSAGDTHSLCIVKP